MFDPKHSVQLASGALFDSESTWRAYLPDAGDWTKTAMSNWLKRKTLLPPD